MKNIKNWWNDHRSLFWKCWTNPPVFLTCSVDEGKVFQNYCRQDHLREHWHVRAFRRHLAKWGRGWRRVQGSDNSPKRIQESFTASKYTLDIWNRPLWFFVWKTLYRNKWVVLQTGRGPLLRQVRGDGREMGLLQQHDGKTWVSVRQETAQRNLRAELELHDGFLAGHQGEFVMPCLYSHRS